MSHDLPNMIGTRLGASDEKVRTVLPAYMAMGETGIGSSTPAPLGVIGSQNLHQPAKRAIGRNYRLTFLGSCDTRAGSIREVDIRNTSATTFLVRCGTSPR